MSKPLTVEPVASDADYAEIGDVMHQAFETPQWPRASIDQWLDGLGRENLRMLRVDGRPAAGLGVLRFGHWLGGRSVPAAGISVVAVASHQRGAGLGAALMRGVLTEMRAEGLPISTLYPSNLPLYRKVGYEIAGARNRFELDLSQAGPPQRDASARPATPADRPAIAAVHQEFGRVQCGLVSRSPTDWRRLLDPVERKPYVFVVEAPAGRITGYVVFSAALQQEAACLSVADLAYATPAAARGLLTLLADHRSIHGKALCWGGVSDPLSPFTPNQTARLISNGVWMLRLLDLPAAIAARGYPADLQTEVEIELDDDLFADNNGRFVLRAEGGVGRAERQTGGTRSPVRCSIRALSAVYSGHRSAEQAAALGELTGPAEALARLSALFAGPYPWMNERF